MQLWRVVEYAALACAVVEVGCGPSPRDSVRGASDSTLAAHSAALPESLNLATAPACVAMAVPKVQLTTYERCALRAFAARCTRGDECMVRCFASGDGRNIGGGCWHVCYAYTGVPMHPLPPGQEACEALSERLSPAR